MKVIFYDSVFPNGPDRHEFKGFDAVSHVDGRLIGSKFKPDGSPDERTVLATIVTERLGKHRQEKDVFFVYDGGTPGTFHHFVMAPEGGERDTAGRLVFEREVTK